MVLYSIYDKVRPCEMTYEVELASRVTLGGLILHSAMKSGLSVIHNVKAGRLFVPLKL